MPTASRKLVTEQPNDYQTAQLCVTNGKESPRRWRKRTRRESEKEEQSATNLLAVRTKAPSLDVSASADKADIFDNLGGFDRIPFRANAESVAATSFNRGIKKFA